MLGMRRVKAGVVLSLAPVSPSPSLRLGHKCQMRAETDCRLEWRGEFDGATARPLDPGSGANSQPRPNQCRMQAAPLMRDNAERPRLVLPASIRVTETWKRAVPTKSRDGVT